MMEHQYIPSNGIHLHVVQAGPKDGPLVILLHGFPEYWRSWKRQIPYLASAGYRVLAPDQRGYNLSDKPQGIPAYGRDALAADIVGLMQNAGREQACVVGHDWGGIVAWWLGIKYRQHVSRLVLLNAPHPTAMGRQLRRSQEQRLRSLYAAFFQLPWLPELVLRAGNGLALAASMTRSSRPGTFSNADLDAYRQAWARPGAMTTMLNWYRAATRVPTARLPHLRVTVPTLILWGARDRFLRRSLATDSVAFCEDGRLLFLEEATHWVQHEEAKRVNGLLDTFLRGGEVR